MSHGLAAAKVFTVPKAGNDEAENEDAAAFRIDDGRLIAAIADGATDAIFSREWARALVQEAMTWPTNDEASVIEQAARVWSDSLPAGDTLPWFAQARLA